MPIVKYVMPIKDQASANEEMYLIIGGKIPLVWLSRAWAKSYKSD